SFNRIVLVAAGCATLTLTACAGSRAKAGGGASTTVAAKQDLAAVCQAGESEGKVSFRDTTDPDVFAKAGAGFEQKYPKIKVDFGSQRPQDSVQRIVTEKQANHAIDVDAISIDLPSAGPVIQQGLIQSVDWSTLGVPTNDVLTSQGAQFVRT